MSQVQDGQLQAAPYHEEARGPEPDKSPHGAGDGQELQDGGADEGQEGPRVLMGGPLAGLRSGYKEEERPRGEENSIRTCTAVRAVYVFLQSFVCTPNFGYLFPCPTGLTPGSKSGSAGMRTSAEGERRLLASQWKRAWAGKHRARPRLKDDACDEGKDKGHQGENLFLWGAWESLEWETCMAAAAVEE